MRKSGLLIFLILLFAGCDPVYHLTYSVVNKSGKTIYVAAKASAASPGFVLAVPPGSSAQVSESGGVGFAREKYRENVGAVSGVLTYFSDSSLSDTGFFRPSLEWQFHRDGLADGHATLTIRKRDLK